MKNLLFKNPVFHKGVNLTVRRGIKWAVVPVGTEINILETDSNILNETGIITKVVVIPFWDIEKEMLREEHDPRCTNHESLQEVMEEVYEDFSANEIVTLLYFTINPKGKSI